MPPKRITVQPSTSSSRRGGNQTPPSYLRSAYDALSAEDNRSVVISVAMFSAAVAFFASDFSEILVPGF